jgi:methionyl-tRNA formyltransferase
LSSENSLRVVFMGTPAFAVPVLTALLDEGYEVVGVYTQPDRETGRGRRVMPTPVKQAALELGLAVYQPASLRRSEEARQELASLAPDLIVVAAYGLFLPVESFDLPRLGTLNVHPSLLPRYRGSSPVSSAILNGDAVTGVTLIRLDEGMDSGPIVAQRETPIAPSETARQLTSRLFQMGADLLVEVLPQWECGELQARPQDDAQATFTSRLSREDGEIDWDKPADYIARQVRAYHPWPGTYTYWRGRMLKVIEAAVSDTQDIRDVSPGQVVPLADGVGVVTGEDVLALRQVQIEGRRAVSASEFLQGHRDFPGSKLGK